MRLEKLMEAWEPLLDAELKLLGDFESFYLDFWFVWYWSLLLGFESIVYIELLALVKRADFGIYYELGSGSLYWSKTIWLWALRAFTDGGLNTF